MTYFIDIHFSDIEYFRIFIFCEIILQQMQNKHPIIKILVLKYYCKIIFNYLSRIFVYNVTIYNNESVSIFCNVKIKYTVYNV